MHPGEEVRHPQWGLGTVLFDKPHCIGIRFVEHGQVNFSQEEWASQKSPMHRFEHISALEFSLQEAVDNMELTEEQAASLLRGGVHELEVRRYRRPSLMHAREAFLANPSDKNLEDDFYTALLGYITATVKRSCHDQATFSNIEDSIQESALEVWQRLEEFNPARSSFMAWVGLITTHNIRDALRRVRTSHGSPQRTNDGLEEPITIRLDDENTASRNLPVDTQYEIKEFTGRLSALDRSIVQMTADGLTLREVGAVLSLSYESIRNRLKKLKIGFDKSNS